MSDPGPDTSSSHPPGQVGWPTVTDPLRLARIRHELRTPINHIVGYSEILIDDAEASGAKSFIVDLHRIRSGGQQLLSLLNQYLGGNSFPGNDRDVQQLCHELRTPVNHVIGYSELLLEQCTEAGLAAFAPDLEKIRAAAKNWLSLMEEQLLNGGLGLVPTARTSQISSDTRLFIKMGERLAAPLPAESRIFNAQRGRLLLADDDAVNRDLLERRLDRLGYSVVSCSDGREVLPALKKGNIELVLLDLLMPGIDGYEVLNQMKADPALRHIPVIIISAMDRLEGIVRCVEIGAEDYLPKPFEPVLLRARIGAALEKKRLRDWEQIYLQQIEDERKKSDQLLLNILPRAIADRLKQGEKLIVDSFPDVTVMFADLVGFTTLSLHIAPSLVVRLLDEIFSLFDDLAVRHGLEKIKTIGDAYMAVAGLPFPRADHAEAVARMALEMQSAIEQFNQRHRISLQMRIGINTGPVIAGIIGRNKFSYDLWGDTVNTASRMESHGVPGGIQVTEATALRLQRGFVLKNRGLVEIKGRPSVVTWWLTGLAA